MEKTDITVRGVELELWRLFRGRCVVEGKTVADKLNDLLKQDIKKKGGE